MAGLDERRLRILLAAFFMALAVPTTLLVWQAFSQLKWEAFHQYRGVAEDLTSRIDVRLNSMINAADARTFSDYAFLVVSGDPSAGFVQRSPLSAYPVVDELPGVLGYFQVDSDGVFSTPLLPPEGTAAASLGIGDDEYTDRLKLAQDIQSVLADNRLLQSRQDQGARRRIATPTVATEPLFEDEKDADKIAAKSIGGFADAFESRSADDAYSQQVFDQLNRSAVGGDGTSSSIEAPGEARQNQNIIGKVSELKLDQDLQKLSEEVEREAAIDFAKEGGLASSPGRSKRKEQSYLPESVAVAGSELTANIMGPTNLRITTFESEVDPFEFSLLGSGHFVLFRKVWRDDRRYIQGLLVDQSALTRDLIGLQFDETPLAEMSNLIIAFQDDVIHTQGGRDRSAYSDVAEDLGGTLLYRNRLSAPLNGLELIFSIKRLPPGPGASVLAWVTLVLAIILVGGFVALYRLGASQIRLARQQQDFVAAVSHELKSPLTSIRMYGEMLKEGWADDDKKQSYY
jgi:hypothetical protein